jgi:hypothetical protein
MKTTFLASSVIVIASLAVNVVSAQTPYRGFRPGPPAQSPPLVQHHASTFEEGYLRGWADLTRASGEYNYNTSLASINREEANRRRIENSVLYTQAYFDKQRINRQARAEKRGQRVTLEQVIHFNKSRLPGRLTDHEFHAATGRLAWPAILRAEPFAAEREAINQTIAARTVDNSGVGSESHREITRLTAELEGKIRGMGKQLSSAERIAARKFLARVAYEARYPVVVVDVASLAGN